MTDCNSQAPLDIHSAADEGNADAVAALLAAATAAGTIKQLLATAGPRGSWQTPLHIAAKKGHEEVVRLLLAAGAAKVAGPDLGLGVLHAAASAGHAGVVRQLLTAGAPVHICDRDNVTALHRAAESGSTETVDVLLQAKAAVNTHSSWATPLQLVAAAGHAAVCRSLLQAGTFVNDVNYGRQTALHLAAYQGHVKVVQVLLQAGADQNIRDRSGHTALAKAAATGVVPAALLPRRFAVVQALVAAGAQVITRNVSGETPLHHATFAGDTAIVELLLSAGADVNVRSYVREETALHLAVLHDRSKILALLLDAGADVHLADRYGQTPISVAIAEGRVDALQSMLASCSSASWEQSTAVGAYVAAAAVKALDCRSCAALDCLIAHVSTSAAVDAAVDAFAHAAAAAARACMDDNSRRAFLQQVVCRLVKTSAWLEPSAAAAAFCSHFPGQKDAGLLMAGVLVEGWLEDVQSEAVACSEKQRGFLQQMVVGAAALMQRPYAEAHHEQGDAGTPMVVV